MWFLQWCGVSVVSSYAVCFLQRGGVSLVSSAIIYNIVKVKVTRWLIDLLTFSKKNPSRAITRSTYIHRRDVTCRPVWPVDPSTHWPFRKRTPEGQLRGPRTYTVEMQCSKRCRIRLCSSSKANGAFCSCVAWGWRIYNIVESESDPLTFSKKNPSRANGRSTYIHPPSLAKIRQRTSEEIGNKQTNTQTNKRCSNYSMILCRSNARLNKRCL